LISMDERIRLCGGTIELEQRHPTGCLLTARVPYTAPVRQRHATAR
jgi:signal transduction histidine kinase